MASWHETLEPVDELINLELKAHISLYDVVTLENELGRVDDVIEDRVMTGDDLTYWFTRRGMLRHEITRRRTGGGV